MKYQKLFCALLFSIIYFTSSSQIDSVDYKLLYNHNTCEFDVYLMIVQGQTTTVQSRIQFGCGVNFIVPDNSTIAVTQSYEPKYNVGGGIVQWVQSSKCLNPNVPDPIDIYRYSVSLSPTSVYPQLVAGDSVRLFSIQIDVPNPLDHDEIRIYRNGIDPPSSLTCLSSFENGFTIGGFNQKYRTNQPKQVEKPSLALQSLTVDASQISISTTTTVVGACHGNLQYEWTGPGNYSGSSPDVLITNPTNSNYGLYTLVVTDSLGYTDTLEVDASGGGSGTDAVTFDRLRIEPSSNEVGLSLAILDDYNTNSQVTYEYKAINESTYDTSATVIRSTPGTIVNGQSLTYNMHSGSIVNLQPNTKYSLKVTLQDPDGGAIIIDTVFTTSYIKGYMGGDTLHVIPGNGGGDGSVNNPYRGVDAALAIAQPGNLLLLGSGIYTPFTVTNGGTVNAPITIKSSQLHGAIIDGNNTNSGVLTIGTSNDSIQHIVIDGLKIQNGQWGIDAKNTQFFTVKNSQITDVNDGIINRIENGWEHDQQVYNNLIEGRTSWPQTSGQMPNAAGVLLQGTNNEISYNTITLFGDGISTGGEMQEDSYSLSIHHNYVHRIVDNGIEVDGTVTNSRVYRNKVYNSRSGVSISPIYAGPAYIFRNEIVNQEVSALKYDNQSRGLVIVNNSIVNSGTGLTSTPGWDDMIFCNNVILSEELIFDENDIGGSIMEWNYNAYYSLRSGTASSPWYTWNGVDYPQLSDFQSSIGLDMTSLIVNLIDFEMVSIPSMWEVEEQSSNYNLEPSSISFVVDKANSLPNLDQAYVIDGIGDIGAYERGAPEEQFGHNFNSACFDSDLSIMTWNGNQGNNWFEPNNWTPCGIPISISDVEIPNGPTNFPEVSTDVHINNMTIRSQAGLKLLDPNLLFQLGGQ